MTTIFPASALTIGEGLLSMYPVVVKSSPVPIDWQVFSRMLIYSLFPLFFASFKELFTIDLTKWILVGIINFLHIWTSYKGFELLDVGFALTVFYLYPIFNLVLSNFILGESISIVKIGLFALPMYLLYSIYSEGNSFKEINLMGILFVIIAALTESSMYVMLKTVNLGESYWNPLVFIYFFSFIGIIIYQLLTSNIVSFKENVLDKEFGKLSLYNLGLGMFGYMLRFWAIPRLPSVLYSVLSYTGIVSGYIFGYLFFNETITKSIFAKLVMFVASLLYIELGPI
jgi:drug/metabolite transporter (DMT)-like permease